MIEQNKDRIDRILQKKNLNSNQQNNTNVFNDIFDNVFSDNTQNIKKEISENKESLTEIVNDVIDNENLNEKTESYDLINDKTQVTKAKNIVDDYEEKRKEVLLKDDLDITMEDLPYINSRDMVYQDLPSRYKRVIKTRESIEYIYKQFGKSVECFLKDPTIIEVQLNQDGSIWIEKFGVGKFKTNIKMDNDKGNAIIKLIADYNGKIVTKESSIISAVLPTGERFEGIIGEPVGNNPLFAIRKKPTKIFTLNDYVEQGVLTPKQRDVLKEQILGKKNILIVGGTSSGKTTFTNGCLDVLKETTDRVLIIEDTPELICDVDNKVELVSTHYTSTNDLLHSGMRLTPDRIIVGEIRKGVVAIELLKLWNSGHDGGFSTIHAGSCQSGLLKLNQYLGEVSQQSQLTSILEAVHVVVTMVKENNKRVVKEIKKVVGYDKTTEQFILEDLVKENE